MLNANSVIGILGGGQLGKMLAEAAHKLHYRTHVFSDQKDSPACLVSTFSTIGAYDDEKLLKEFAAACTVVTFEFENIPLRSAEIVAEVCPLSPSLDALRIFQNRILEKSFLREQNIPCAPFAVVNDSASFDKAVREIGYPAVLKTASLGYDGKGQSAIKTPEDAVCLMKNFINNDYVLEAFVDFEAEVSIIAARAANGEFKTWGLIENEHKNHILHMSLAPATCQEKVLQQAVSIAEKIACGIKYVGVFCVEFFLTKNHALLVNEVAPRVHNSGHLTIDAARCSQFEQHIRAISGLPLEEAVISQPAVMLNLLGDLWKSSEPDWQRLLAGEDIFLYLYGKKEAKNGRKMGHLTLKGEDLQALRKKAQYIYNKLNN